MNLVGSYDAKIISGAYYSFFDTFSRTIVIYKESQKILIPNPNPPQNFIYGFGVQQAQNNYTYQQVTGVYPALIIYKDDQKHELLTDPNLFTTPGELVIKVKSDGMNFIENGKTEKILVDNRYFEIVSDVRQKTLLTNMLYQYVLQEVK